MSGIRRKGQFARDSLKASGYHSWLIRQVKGPMQPAL